MAAQFRCVDAAVIRVTARETGAALSRHLFQESGSRLVLAGGGNIWF